MLTNIAEEVNHDNRNRRGPRNYAFRADSAAGIRRGTRRRFLREGSRTEAAVQSASRTGVFRLWRGAPAAGPPGEIRVRSCELDTVFRGTRYPSGARNSERQGRAF